MHWQVAKNESREKRSEKRDTISLLGDSLFTEIDSTSQAGQIDKLAEAENLYGEDPSLENLIWIGRREAYLGRYDLAIRTFSKAAKQFPESFEPLRHR